LTHIYFTHWPPTANSFQKLLPYLPRDPHLDVNKGPWIAGGCVRKLWQGQPWYTGDVDVFFSSPQQYEAWRQWFGGNKMQPNNSYTCDQWATGVWDWVTNQWQSFMTPERYVAVSAVKKTDNSESFMLSNMRKHMGVSDDVTIQLVHLFYPQSLQELFDYFDLSVCQFATTGHGIWYTQQAAEDCRNGTLRFIHLQNSKCPPMRLIKYMMYGFQPSNQDIMMCADKIAQGDFQWDSY
jgi:hypothetical protein